MSVQGNLKPVRSLVEPLQVAMDNGAKRALIPIENKRSFLEVDADIVEHVDPMFYGDPQDCRAQGAGRDVRTGARNRSQHGRAALRGRRIGRGRGWLHVGSVDAWRGPFVDD